MITRTMTQRNIDFSNELEELKIFKSSNKKILYLEQINNSYERLKYYLACEQLGLFHKKFSLWETRDVCGTHKKILEKRYDRDPNFSGYLSGDDYCPDDDTPICLRDEDWVCDFRYDVSIKRRKLVIIKENISIQDVRKMIREEFLQSLPL